MPANVDPELKYRFFWLCIGYALIALVVCLSVVSDPVNVRLNFPYEDKVYHMLAYFTLMAWFAQIYHQRLWRMLLIVGFILLGILMEYIQSFDSSRYAEAGDILANTSGVIAGYLFNLTAARYTLVKIERLIS
jgi:hypothetical protein